jgi:hypothetical protein
MRGEGAGSRRRVCFRLKAQLFALAGDVVDAIGTAEEPCGFLDRAAVFNFGLEVIDIHLGSVSVVVNVHHASRFDLRRPQYRSLRSGLDSRTAWRLTARRVAMRANSIGPPRSAALVISSAAVRTTGVPRSEEGMVLTRCTIASRNDASLTPPGSSMGSGKRLSQETTQLRNRTGIQAGTGRLVTQSAGESVSQSPCAKRVEARPPLFQGSFVSRGKWFRGPWVHPDEER